MRSAFVVSFLALFVLITGMVHAQGAPNASLPSPTLIVLHDRQSGQSELLRTDANGRVLETLLILEGQSSETAVEHLSVEEFASVKKIMGEKIALDILNRPLNQSLDRIWKIDKNIILAEITYSICDNSQGQICFGDTEYRILENKTLNPPVISIDFHGAVHHEGKCGYQEIITHNKVKINQTNKLISITVMPATSCLNGVDDIYTFVFADYHADVSMPVKLQGAIGFTSFDTQIAYYQLRCEALECEASLITTTLYDKEEKVLTTQTLPLNIALMLDAKWLSSDILFYQQYNAEPQSGFTFYIVDIDTGETTLAFSDYTPWPMIFLVADRLVGFASGSGEIVTFNPFTVVSSGVYQILDSADSYLLYTQSQDCIGEFTLLNSDLSVSNFNADIFFNTSDCISDILLTPA